VDDDDDDDDDDDHLACQCTSFSCAQKEAGGCRKQCIMMV